MKPYLIVIIGIILVLGIVTAGTILGGNSTITINPVDKLTLAGVGVTTPVISELICDGLTCRACSTSNGYGMGCISISQLNCTNTCIPYTNDELKVLRDEAFKSRWEEIAGTIRTRQSAPEIKIDKGDITLR